MADITRKVAEVKIVWNGLGQDQPWSTHVARIWFISNITESICNKCINGFKVPLCMKHSVKHHTNIQIRSYFLCTVLAVELGVFLIRVSKSLIKTVERPIFVACCGLLASSREFRETCCERSLLRSGADFSFWSRGLRLKSCTVFIEARTYNKIHVLRKRRSEVMQGCDDVASDLETLKTVVTVGYEAMLLSE
jgi:hypothetical protein